MLGALSLKWKWRERREATGKPTDKPNLVFGGDVHVVWEKFCRYFDVEPRIVPLQENKIVIGPEDVEPHIDENTIGVAAVLGTTFTGHSDDIVGINTFLRPGTRGLYNLYVVDPSEERIKAEFEGVKRTYLPMHSVIRVDEVKKQGVSRITALEGGSNVAQFPMSLYSEPATDGVPKK